MGGLDQQGGVVGTRRLVQDLRSEGGKALQFGPVLRVRGTDRDTVADRTIVGRYWQRTYACSLAAF